MINIRTQSIENPSKSDSSLNQIKLLAWQLADSHQTTHAIALFRKFLEQQDTVDGHLEFAKILSVFDSSSAAIDHLEENFVWMNHSSSAEQLTRTHNEMASHYRQVGQHSAARREQQQAIRHDLSCSKNGELSTQTLLGQACDLSCLDELVPAKYLLISLLKQTDEIGTLVRIRLAEIYLREEEIDAAKLMLNEALEICEQKQQINLQVQALSLLSQACAMNDELKIAMKYSAEALDIAKDSARCVNEIFSLQEEAQKLRMKMRVLCQSPDWN